MNASMHSVSTLIRPFSSGPWKRVQTAGRINYVYPFCCQYVFLLSRVDLDEWEHVTCMKTVALRSQETVSGLKGYIAAGTCVMQGEEVTCRGRVAISYSPYTDVSDFCNSYRVHLLLSVP